MIRIKAIGLDTGPMDSRAGTVRHALAIPVQCLAQRAGGGAPAY